MKIRVFLSDGKQVDFNLSDINKVVDFSDMLAKVPAGKFINIGENIAISKDHVIMVQKIE